jgi:hypothetical protein
VSRYLIPKESATGSQQRKCGELGNHIQCCSIDRSGCGDFSNARMVLPDGPSDQIQQDIERGFVSDKGRCTRHPFGGSDSRQAVQ